MIIKASSYTSGSTYNYPWSTLPWFGTDGQADDAKIITPTSTRNLVAQVKLASTVFAATNNTKTQALFSEFASKYPTQTCDSYCLGAYDDVWLGAMATIQAGSNNGTAIQAYLQQYISTYNGSLFGVTGSMSFQASGDRTKKQNGSVRVSSGGRCITTTNLTNSGSFSNTTSEATLSQHSA